MNSMNSIPNRNINPTPELMAKIKFLLKTFLPPGGKDFFIRFP